MTLRTSEFPFCLLSDDESEEVFPEDNSPLEDFSLRGLVEGTVWSLLTFLSSFTAGGSLALLCELKGEFSVKTSSEAE